jgi:hypothetical protein
MENNCDNFDETMFEMICKRLNTVLKAAVVIAISATVLKCNSVICITNIAFDGKVMLEYITIWVVNIAIHRESCRAGACMGRSPDIGLNRHVTSHPVIEI